VLADSIGGRCGNTQRRDVVGLLQHGRRVRECVAVAFRVAEQAGQVQTECVVRGIAGHRCFQSGDHLGSTAMS
jgi:hypothetical protein